MQWDVFRYHHISAKLSIDSAPTQLQSSFIKPSFQIIKKPVQIDIKARRVTCDIDGTECKAQEGHKTIWRLTSDFAQEGLEKANEAAQQTTNEGVEMSDAFAARNKGIIQQIQHDHVFADQREYGLAFIPSQPPKLIWQDSPLQIDVQPAEYTYQWDVSSNADIRVTQQGYNRIDVSQYPSMQIEYVGEKGRNFDVSV